MKIVTWNLGYWQHRSHHDDAWRYLTEEIKPDLAFLQEVEPPAWLATDSYVFERTSNKNGHVSRWGTAVYAPDLALAQETIELHPSRTVVATLSVQDLSLFVASVHAPIINGRVFPHLDEIFQELEAHSAFKQALHAIVGGDLNAARLAEEVWPKKGHGAFFERIDSGEVWMDCCRKFHPVEIQTFFRANSVNPFQDDHIFVTPGLGDRVSACDALNNEITRRVSDHIPVIVEIDL